jgi:Ca2+/Na+ antiporter
MAEEYNPKSLRNSQDLSLTEVMPVFSHKIHLLRNKFLAPAIILAVVSIMFLVFPWSFAVYTWMFGAYLMFTLFCVIYFYSRVDRPLWIYAIPPLIMVIILMVNIWSYTAPCTPPDHGTCLYRIRIFNGFFYFDPLLANFQAKSLADGGVLWENIVAMFAQPGLREEFVKAIPGLLGAGLTLAAVPFIYLYAIILPPVGLLINGQRISAAVNVLLTCAVALFAIGLHTYGLLLLLPLHAVVSIFIHNRRKGTAYYQSKFYQMLRVRSPLDGLMLGVAAGLMFTLIENAAQYVPAAGTEVLQQQPGADALAALRELLTLIPRSLDSFLGHFGWAGISGYFIGLTVIRPKAWFVLLPIGWFIPALLHGLWDGLAFSDTSWWTFLPLDLASFVIFVACLLKARQLHMGLYPASEQSFE